MRVLFWDVFFDWRWIKNIPKRLKTKNMYGFWKAFSVLMKLLSLFHCGGQCPPPKTYESNLIRREFVQFGKQHSRCKVILLSIVLSQEGCEVYLIYLAVAKPLWDLTGKYYWNCTLPPYTYWFDPSLTTTRLSHLQLVHKNAFSKRSHYDFILSVSSLRSYQLNWKKHKISLFSIKRY